ncbi:TPA: hypothetical protein U2B14_001493 [Streptococcus suis]|nr:hypothetical protein [Streptococcus suis]HEM5951248.1 hypothetical protein [Streptococcus suis]
MLKVVDVCKRYGAHQVLSYVSFELQAGDLVALVGPNGVGEIHPPEYHRQYRNR